jgi:hypothetical protein
MKKKLLLPFLFFIPFATLQAQVCAFDSQITTSDSVLCAGDATVLSFVPLNGMPADTVVPTPIVNNNGQDGNMFDITATNTIRVRYFEGNIANTPNLTTQYYIYYKVGSHVGSETNAAAWTMIAGPITVTPNAPNTLTVIPVNVNIVIPAGQTYAFYLTNTSAATNNNRYHNGTATGAVLTTNSDLTVYEGTGGAYPFGTFFNARPWEGIVHYDYPPATVLWNTGATTTTITVQPGSTTNYSCVGTVMGAPSCTVEDTITIQVNSNPVVALGNNAAICQGNSITLDAGNAGATFNWCSGETTQAITTSNAGSYCVSVSDVNGCVGSDTINVIVNSLPAVVASGDTICIGASGMLTASGSTATYLWSPGAFSGAVVSAYPTATTSYTVTATDVNGCTAMDSAMIMVNPLPVIQTSGDTICFNAAAIISAAGNATSYLWQPGNFSTDTVSVSSAASSTYTVTATDANGCSIIDSATVIVNTLPSLTVSGDTICEGSTGTMSAGGSGISYAWNPGSFTGQIVSDSPLSTTNYTVTSTDVNNCTSSSTVTMVVDPLPSVSASSQGTHCLDDAPFTLTGGSPAGGIYSGAGVSGATLTPTAAGNGTHTVTYTYTDANGCSASDSSTVIINPCTGIISNTSETGVTIYPNPFHESATVSVHKNAPLQNATFTLYDITGKIVLQMVNLTSTTISIDRNTLESGVYFYTLVDNGVEIGSGKLIVD